MGKIVIFSFEEIILAYILPYFQLICRFCSESRLDKPNFSFVRDTFFKENFVDKQSWSFSDKESLKRELSKLESSLVLENKLTEKYLLSFKAKGFTLATLSRQDFRKLIVDAHKYHIDLSIFKYLLFSDREGNYEYLQSQNIDLNSSFLVTSFLDDYCLARKFGLNCKILIGLYNEVELLKNAIPRKDLISSVDTLTYSIS